MARWKSLILLVASPLLLLLTQIIVFQVVYLIEGPPDPNRPALTPLAIAATGLSTGITAVLTTIIVAKMAKVPWQAVFRHTRRFDWGRVGIYLLGSAPLVGLSAIATAIIAPETTGWGTFAFGGTTIAIIAVSVFATPVQAAGEEITFRGAVMPAAGSWIRNPRIAFAFSIFVSSVLFAAIHVTIAPWFVAYMFVFTTATALIGLFSGGLEAAIAFHVANNFTVGVVNALFAGNEASVVDRGAGSDPGSYLLIQMVMNVLIVVMVWLMERARRRRVANSQ